MTYTSIFEKILFILNIISTSWTYIAFIAIVLLLIILLGLKKISKKKCFILIIIATKLVLGYTIYIYYEPISNLINSIVDNLFLNIYFPSAYFYLFILLLTNIVTIGSLLKPKGNKTYKTVNGICLIITNFILALVLEVISKDNVDVFSKESLFTNTSLVTLLEFSVNIFVTWLISLVAIYIIDNITKRIMIVRENKRLVTEVVVPIDTSTVLDIDEEEIKNTYKDTTIISVPALENPVQAFIPDTQNKFIPNFTISTKDIEEYSQSNVVGENTDQASTFNSYISNYTYDNNSFDLSAFIPKKQEVKPLSILEEKANTTEIFEQILKNELPYIKEEVKVEPKVEDVKNTYTLNDYRIFNKILKDIRDHNGSNSVTIDKKLEYRLITKYSTETYNMFKTMLKIYSN